MRLLDVLFAVTVLTFSTEQEPGLNTYDPMEMKHLRQADKITVDKTPIIKPPFITYMAGELVVNEARFKLCHNKSIS